MNSNVFVVDNASTEAGAEFSIIGFRNILPLSMSSGPTVDGEIIEDTLQYIDPKHPLERLYDYSDNTEMSFTPTHGSFAIEFSQQEPMDIDYMGILSKNGGSAGLEVKLEIYDTFREEWTEIADFSVLDGKPYTVYFGNKSGYASNVYKSDKQRFTFTFQNKVFITQIYIGKAIVFPFTPTTGFQPAHTAPMDEVQQFHTDGNNFIVGRRIKKGFQTKGTLRFILFDDIDQYWPEYQQHVLNSRPVFFLWSNDRPQQSIFGLQNARTLTKPTYATSLRANLDFEINGYA